MSWIETLTKETFFSAIREAMKPQIDQIDTRMRAIESNMVDLRERVSRLEGVVEGSTKANEANIRAYELSMRNLILEFKADFLQRQLDQKTGYDQHKTGS